MLKNARPLNEYRADEPMGEATMRKWNPEELKMHITHNSAGAGGSSKATGENKGDVRRKIREKKEKRRKMKIESTRKVLCGDSAITMVNAP